MRTRSLIAVTPGRRATARRRTNSPPRRPRVERVKHSAEDSALLRLIEKLKKELQQQPADR